MAKSIQNIMAEDTKCGSPLVIISIPTHIVVDTLGGTTSGFEPLASAV